MDAENHILNELVMNLFIVKVERSLLLQKLVIHALSTKTLDIKLLLIFNIFLKLRFIWLDVFIGRNERPWYAPYFLCFSQFLQVFFVFFKKVI